MNAAAPRPPESKRFLIDESWFRTFVGAAIMAPLVRFVVATNRKVYDPPDHLAASEALEPAIYVTWHANLLAQPVVVPSLRRVMTMASPHPDGRLGQALAEALGTSTIVAEGGFDGKGASGGIAGFRGMLRALKDGRSLLLTGEVPPLRGRELAPGIVAAARLSGRPIIPVAVASTRRKIVERLWDRMQINLPFGTMFIQAAPAIWVSKDNDADEAAMAVKKALDAAYDTAMAKAEAARRA